MTAAFLTKIVLELTAFHYLPNDVSDPVTVPTHVACARPCMYNQTCRSMIYNTKTKECFFYWDWARDSGARKYPVNKDLLMFNTNKNPCPLESGYTFNKTLVMCYKYHTSGKTHADAQATCVGEGGDGLVRVDSPEKKRFFGELLFAKVWVDGQRINGTWSFSGGGELREDIKGPHYETYDAYPNCNCLAFFRGVFGLPCDWRDFFICERFM